MKYSTKSVGYKSNQDFVYNFQFAGLKKKKREVE